MTHLTFLFLALTTIGTAEARPTSPAPERAQVENNARPAAAPRAAAVPTRPAAVPARPAAHRPPPPQATPARTVPQRVHVTRVRRGGEWVHTAPRRFAAGNLLWIGDRSAYVVRVHNGRALIEYRTGARSWIRIG